MTSMACGSAIASSWFNGNFDGRNGLNSSGEGTFDSETYDQFGVGPGGADVTSVYMIVLTSNNADQVGIFNWSIRSGVASGSGGTLLFGSSGAGGSNGSGAATVIPFGRQGQLNEFQILVSGITGVHLGPGLYWLGGDIGGNGGSNDIYTATTGAGNGGFNDLGGGSPAFDTGLSFWNSPSFGENWVPASTGLGTGIWDFSMGIEGSSAPEPTSTVTLGIGFLSLIARRRRQCREECG